MKSQPDSAASHVAVSPEQRYQTDGAAYLRAIKNTGRPATVTLRQRAGTGPRPQSTRSRMNAMRASLIALTGIALAAIAATAPALAADEQRGRALYENHCQGCHSVKVHNRRQRWPADISQLRDIVDRWQAQQNLRWSRDDIDDVVYYLNVTQYSY